MQIFVSDSQNVGGTSEQIFELIQPTPVDTHIILENAGANTLNYAFYEFIGGVYTVMDDPGTELQDAMLAGTAIQITLAATGNKVKLMGSASGGTLLRFGLTRLTTRLPGGTIPILNV